MSSFRLATQAYFPVVDMHPPLVFGWRGLRFTCLEYGVDDSVLWLSCVMLFSLGVDSVSIYRRSVNHQTARKGVRKREMTGLSRVAGVNARAFF